MSGTMIHGLLSIVAGILILLMPRMLNYVVAAYLIIFGIVTLIHW
jgi:uncharacterized membrane protein HdeD (DUF308 family)